MKSLISFQAEIESFMSVSATGLQILVKLVENTTEHLFLAMTRKQWSSIASVGDQSEHITNIAQTLAPTISIIRQLFSSTPKFFKLFCDKFTEYTI